jgi:hypothetical protein
MSKLKEIIDGILFMLLCVMASFGTIHLVKTSNERKTEEYYSSPPTTTYTYFEAVLIEDRDVMLMYGDIEKVEVWHEKRSSMCFIDRKTVLTRYNGSIVTLYKTKVIILIES